MRQRRAELSTPTADEVSAYMASLAEARWKRYAERVARGEITADNYLYRPRGPMSPEMKAERDLTRWERQIANAQLVRFALEGRKLSGRKIQALAGRSEAARKTRPHLRFNGKRPRQWHSAHYNRIRKNAQTDPRTSG